MKKKIVILSAAAMTIALSAAAFISLGRFDVSLGEENEAYDGARLAAELEVLKTHDVKLGYVPNDRLLPAINAAAASKLEVASRIRASLRRGDGADTDAPQVLNWVERGPYVDSISPTAGNQRPNAGTTSGRIRGIVVDASDPSGNTVVVGGVDGGIWRTTNINSAAPTWTHSSDFLSNLAVTDIAQDPRPAFRNIMYFTTGEAYNTGGAVRGVGVFKSVDGGLNWSLLPNTSQFHWESRVVVDGNGTVYVGTGFNGLQRSSDGGTNWTNITPDTITAQVGDLGISSTGRLHATFSYGAGQSAYRYTDIPGTVTSGSGWNVPSGLSSSNQRIELGIAGNTLYACPVFADRVPTIYKSSDGGATWAPTVSQPPVADWASQANYALTTTVNPANPQEVIVGGLDNYKSVNGGQSWTKLSEWIGNTGQYVHADQQQAVWYPDGQRIIFVSDGGVFYTSDGGTTIRDRNAGLRIKQFYSVAIHPTLTNSFLAGSQDNGTHRMLGAGLGSSVEVISGDGCFTAIDRDTPSQQYGSYVYNRLRYSTDSGVNWTFCDMSDTGLFVNPFELDSAANIIYSSDASGTFRRWSALPSCGTAAQIAVTNLTDTISSVAISPYTPNRVIFGTANSGALMRVDNANSIATGTAGTPLGTLPAGFVSSIGFGTSDSNLIATRTNYGGGHVFVSINSGSGWTDVSGNLPDMPVRWAMFKPGTNTAAIIATEAGVWETTSINGAATIWSADPSFPTVRTDMLRYRPSDGLIAAATYGRGLWTTAVPTAASVTVSGRVYAGADGRGLKNAKVTIASNDGTSQTVITGPRGTFQFANVQAGQAYVVSVASRRFAFEPRTITVEDSIADMAFYPSASGEKVRR